MTARIVPRVKLEEVLAFLKSRGIQLNDEGIKFLSKKMEEEPIGKPMFERSKEFIKNPLMKEILDRSFVKRSERFQRIIDGNPLLNLINERKKNLGKEKPPPDVPMPETLRVAFHDESKWQPFFPFMYIPPKGQIIKVQVTTSPDMPYIAFLVPQSGVNYLYSTRRKIDLEQQPGSKYFRLKEGVFQYEIDEVNDLEKGYYEYIMTYHK